MNFSYFRENLEGVKTGGCLGSCEVFSFHGCLLVHIFRNVSFVYYGYKRVLPKKKIMIVIITNYGCKKDVW